MDIKITPCQHGVVGQQPHLPGTPNRMGHDTTSVQVCCFENPDPFSFSGPQFCNKRTTVALL
jgi:hypothetical protein